MYHSVTAIPFSFRIEQPVHEISLLQFSIPKKVIKTHAILINPQSAGVLI